MPGAVNHSSRRLVQSQSTNLSLDFSGPRRRTPTKTASTPCWTAGFTLVETLVVLAIIAAMLGLLMPALQAARESARGAVCRNNLRQLRLAMNEQVRLSKKFPELGQWTIAVLPWLEEQSLADALREGRTAAAVHRPPLLACPSQPDPAVAGSEFRTSWYMLVVDRPPRGRKSDRLPYNITDRPRDTDVSSLRPWFEGPEMRNRDSLEMSRQELGPHGGSFQ